MLIGHWKLDGNANDSSGNNQHATTVSGVTYSNGKINQCGDFSSSTTDYIKISLNKALGQTFSIAGWFLKRAHTVTSYPIFLSFGLPYIACSGSTSSFRVSYNRESDSAQVNLSGTTIPILDAWYHVAIISGTETLKIYINGIEENSTTVLSHYDFSTQFDLGRHLNNNTYSIDGQVDDVRVYDHILSQKEIHELSLAQVLHYDFNMFSEPTTNYVPDADFSTETLQSCYRTASNSGVLSFVDDTTFIVTNNKVIKFEHLLGAASESITLDYNNANGKLTTAATGQIWTCTIYAKGTVGGEYCQLFIFGLNSSNTYVENSAVNIYTTTQWERYTITRTMTHADTVGISMRLDNNTLGNTIYFAGWQVEQKDHVTPFVNGSRTGQVLDNSGNDNHSIALIESTTPKHTTGIIGSGAYNFDGVNDYIDTNLKPNETDFSVSAWFRADSTITNQWKVISNYKYYTGGGTSRGFNFGIPYNDYDAFQFSINLNGDSNTGNAYKNAIIDDGVLYHAVGTFKGGDFVRLYINGILVGSDTTNIPASCDITYNIRIGRRGQDTYFWDGLIDDVRIYATVLEEADILELYQTRASIDDEGQLWVK